MDERRIRIETPVGDHEVWTRKIGNHPTRKILLLHGGPGASHELFECFEDHLDPHEYEFYYYDQLGSYRSDQPDDPALWQIDRFVDEVEQVRTALGLNRSNFYLLGQSWGGLLAMEYALAHQQHLKALVISNMMSSCPAYNAYARDVLMPGMDPAVLTEIQGYEDREDYDNPRFTELLTEHHYVHHVMRAPSAQWPEAVVRGLQRINPNVYIPMQGPSELGLKGTLEDWDRSGDLAEIEVPTLTIGANHDTMDPAHLAWMAKQMPRGRNLTCPNGSHLAQYDDPEHYFTGLKRFINDVDQPSM